MAKLTTAEFIDAIKELSVLELNDLVKACEEEFGVSAAAGVVVAAAGADGAAAEEKTEFDVELTEVGPNKVKVIKVVREITGLGLKEAKDAVDGAPKVIKEQLDKASAEDAKAKLEAEGAGLEQLEKLTLGGLRKAVVDGDVDNGSVMAGQSAGLVKEICSCKDLITKVMTQGEQLLSKGFD